MLVLGITSVISYTLLASYRTHYRGSAAFLFFSFFKEHLHRIQAAFLNDTLIVLMSAWMKKVRDVTGFHPESPSVRHRSARRKMEEN